jgi:hypothetical protein
MAAALVLLSGCSLASNETSNIEEEIPYTSGDVPPGFDEYELSKTDVRADKYQEVADAIGVEAFWVPARPYVPVEVEAVAAIGSQCILGIAQDPMADMADHYIVQLLSRYDFSASIMSYNMAPDQIATFLDEFTPECNGERPFDPANHGFATPADPNQEV